MIAIQVKNTFIDIGEDLDTSFDCDNEELATPFRRQISEPLPRTPGKLLALAPLDCFEKVTTSASSTTDEDTKKGSECASSTTDEDTKKESECEECEELSSCDTDDEFSTWDSTRDAENHYIEQDQTMYMQPVFIAAIPFGMPFPQDFSTYDPSGIFMPPWGGVSTGVQGSTEESHMKSSPGSTQPTKACRRRKRGSLIDLAKQQAAEQASAAASEGQTTAASWPVCSFLQSPADLSETWSPTWADDHETEWKFCPYCGVKTTAGCKACQVCGTTLKMRDGGWGSFSDS
jgi:hypothetical protein